MVARVLYGTFGHGWTCLSSPALRCPFPPSHCWQMTIQRSQDHSPINSRWEDSNVFQTGENRYLPDHKKTHPVLLFLFFCLSLSFITMLLLWSSPRLLASKQQIAVAAARCFDTGLGLYTLKPTAAVGLDVITPSLGWRLSPVGFSLHRSVPTALGQVGFLPNLRTRINPAVKTLL